MKLLPTIKPRKYDLNPSEFLAAVAGEMTPAELGVYWMICLLQYERRGPIKNDMTWLRRKFKATHGLSVVDNIVRKLIASGRVESEGGAISVRRVSEEIASAQRRVSEAAARGQRGGMVSNKTNGLDQARAPAHAPVLSTSTSTSTIESPLPSYPSLSESQESSPLLSGPPISKPPQQSPPVEPGSTSPPSGGHGGKGNLNGGNQNAQRRGTRLPPAWQPSQDDQQFAIAWGCDPDTTADEFRDYWLSNPGPIACALDWSAPFRDWCRRKSLSLNGKADKSRPTLPVDRAREIAERQAAATRLAELYH